MNRVMNKFELFTSYLTRIVFYFCLIFISFVLASCDDKSYNHPSGVVDSGGKDDKGKTDKDKNSKPTPVSCDEQWIGYVKFNPLGQELIYQETHSITVKKETSIVSQNVVQLKITENTNEKVSWTKATKLILPEKGLVNAELSMNKKDFLDLCLKGVTFKISERPLGLKPTSKRDEVFTIGVNKYDVSYEVYNYKRSGVFDNEVFEAWIGSKSPYEGVLFKSIRHYMGNETGEVTEHTIEKVLGDLKNSP